MPLNTPNLAGDVSGGVYATSVDKLKGNAVAATAPTNGQTLVWSGTAWTPATPSSGGGGGANGLTYYLNQGTNADAPTTNLPGTPKQLGRSADASQTTAASGTLTQTTWTQFAGFVSESTPQDPGSTDIPAGLWDFNVWLLGVANSNQSNQVRVKVFKYDGSAAPTLLATSAAVTIGTTAALVGFTVLVPETAMLVTDRIFVTLEAYATGNGHSVTGQFGGNTPSHVHTSLGLVAGTGLWKNVAGTLQSPASLLVDADVDDAAAIAQSKIANLTTDLGAKAAQAQVQVFTTNGTWTKPAGARMVNIQLLAGGGGGGSGRKDSTSATIRCGGGGGGGGSIVNVTAPASVFAATETITIGAGGGGGAAQATDVTNGTGGGTGTATSFGANIVAPGGTGGGGGTATTGTGGSGVLQGNSAASASTTGGAGSTGVPSAVTSAAQPGGASGASGGGLGASNTAVAGASGGRGLIVNLAGGLAGAVGANATNGNANTLASTGLFATGSGGGSGGSSIAANGGNGGSGGFPAAGGGGGGACGFSSGFSGAGGAGAAGIAIITTYF